MTVISKKRLVEYWSVHPQSKEGLEDWHRALKKNTYTSLIEMQSSIIDVEYLKGHDRYCFNIHGNKYRLIARITWGVTVFVVEVLTHAEYTKKYVEKRSRK